ncbi:MAG: hypothetical protein V1732_04985 [Patescibacteria group bacterium]|nr:hypothetical protein [Patescibacteria group bacterium]
MPKVVTKEQFEKLFRNKLGGHYEHALTIFIQYGKILSWDVANVLLHAADKDNVENVLAELEKHWEEHLQFQHPEIRGTVENRLFGVNETQTMFLQICKNVLQLQPA